MNNPFQNALIEYMQNTGDSVKNVASICNTSETNISRFVSGAHIPSTLVFATVCHSLQLDVIQIIGELSVYYRMNGAQHSKRNVGENKNEFLKLLRKQIKKEKNA